MSAVIRKGDNTGHDDYPAVALNTGSSNVFINNTLAVKSQTHTPPITKVKFQVVALLCL